MKLNYHRTGEGPALLILHGLFGTWENWGAQIKMLAKEYDVIAADLRNHGESPHAEETGYAAMAEDVLELMDHLSLEQAHILGHSMGGKVAMQLAQAHPSRVRSLIVADIAPVNYGAHHDQVFKGLFNVQLDGLKSRSEADKQLAEHIEIPGVRAFLLKNLQKDQDGRFVWKMNLNGLHQGYSSISSEPPAESPYNGPVLFIKGGDSDYLKQEHADAIRSRFPNARFKVIEGTGHWLHAEKPGAFNRIVERFLDDQA